MESQFLLSCRSGKSKVAPHFFSAGRFPARWLKDRLINSL